MDGPDNHFRIMSHSFEAIIGNKPSFTRVTKILLLLTRRIMPKTLLHNIF